MTFIVRPLLTTTTSNSVNLVCMSRTVQRVTDTAVKQSRTVSTLASKRKAATLNTVCPN